MRNLKKCSTSSILPLKSTLLWICSSTYLDFEYRYFYAHENNTLFEKSHLLCTKVDLITIQGKVEKFDIIDNIPRHVKTKIEDSSWSQTWQFLLIHSKTFQWHVRFLSYPNPYYDIRKWTVFYLTKTRNLTKIIFVFSAHWQCIWTVTMVSTLSLLDTLQTI